MLNIAICGNSNAASGVPSALERYQVLRRGLTVKWETFRGGDEIVEALKTGSSFNLFLLDDYPRGMNGFQTARIIRGYDENVHIVFLASSPGEVLENFGIRPLAYISGAVKDEELFGILGEVITLCNARKEFGREHDGFLIFPAHDSDARVDFSNIAYIEALNDRLIMRCSDGKQICGRSIKVSIQTAAAPLFCDKRFLKIGKNYIINTDEAKERKGRFIIMKDGTKIPVPLLQRLKNLKDKVKIGSQEKEFYRSESTYKLHRNRSHTVRK